MRPAVETSFYHWTNQTTEILSTLKIFFFIELTSICGFCSTEYLHLNLFWTTSLQSLNTLTTALLSFIVILIIGINFLAVSILCIKHVLKVNE